MDLENPFFSDSDGSSEDEVGNQISLVLAPRRYAVRPQFFESLSEYEFKERFRLSKDTVLNISLILDPLLRPRPRSTRHAITTINQILIALRFYATGTFQLVNGDLFKLAQPTISRIVKRVTRAICTLRPNYISMPTSEEDMRNVKQQFFSMIHPNGIPNVIGLIDGTHVKIISPGGEDAERFRNRKGYFSINVQVVGGPDLRAFDVEARWPGSVHDSYIFDMSCIKMRFVRGDFNNSFLLGDSGYASAPYMLTPLSTPTTVPERRYQRAHVTTRNGVERLFGVAKRRFPALASGLQIDMNTVLSVIVACFILHNIAILANDSFEQFDIVEEDGIHENSADLTEQNNTSRDNIIFNFFSHN